MRASPPFIVLSRLSAGSRDASGVRALAMECGLAVAGIAAAEPFAGLEPVLHDRIERGAMAGLDWFTRERASFSANPRNLLPGARSIVTVGLPYWSGVVEKPRDGVLRGRIARYAWGLDYHDVIKRRMTCLVERLESMTGRSLQVRTLSDTARIVDRAVAARAGTGWYGKHTCLIVSGHGSWVMLGEILLDLELEPTPPLENDCGRCSICLDRCPTGAIVAPYQVETSRCLSFQTIEQKGSIPHELRPMLGDWVFGCDVCQDVCPYTGAAQPVFDPEMTPRSVEHVFPSLARLLALDAGEFRNTYRGSAITRAKRRGMARNAAVALGNCGSEDAVPPLTAALATHDEPLVRGHAAWALGTLGGGAANAALQTAWTREEDGNVRGEIERALS